MFFNVLKQMQWTKKSLRLQANLSNLNYGQTALLNNKLINKIFGMMKAQEDRTSGALK